MFHPIALIAAVLAIAGIAQALMGWRSVRKFAAARPPACTARPPITLLKPLYGDEPLLEAALASVFTQTYPDYQIVFGVQDRHDPAIAVVEQLRARFPERDVTLVIDTAQHGKNRKISNLINMLPSVRHDLLVIADSDLHCAPDYLDRIAAEFAVPGTGLVTTLYAALSSSRSLAGKLGASAINHGFLAGALMARDLGRQDCLGASMALTRDTLAAIGGLHALVDHLADDNVLGSLVRAQGLGIRLATTVPATTVPETGLDALFRHELRWSRTILSLVPAAFVASAVQFPLFWAGLAALVSGSGWFAALFIAAWIVRAGAALGIDRSLGLVRAGLATKVPFLLLPIRDLMSMAIIFASYASDKVEWRGQVMHTRTPEMLPASTPFTQSDHVPSQAPQGTVMS